MQDLDVWRAAHQMIQMYGEAAVIHAALRADHLLDQGDPDGFHSWKRVVDAITDFQCQAPKPNERAQ